MAMILIVEDDVFHRDLLSRFVTYLGHEVTLAANGAEAMAIVQDAAPQIVIMDMGLPVIDGWQATEQLRATFSRAALPIIALTAYAHIDERERCMAAGCNNYLTKPIDFAQLEACVTQWITQR